MPHILFRVTCCTRPYRATHNADLYFSHRNTNIYEKIPVFEREPTLRMEMFSYSISSAVYLTTNVIVDTWHEALQLLINPSTYVNDWRHPLPTNSLLSVSLFSADSYVIDPDELVHVDDKCSAHFASISLYTLKMNAQGGKTKGVRV